MELHISLTWKLLAINYTFLKVDVSSFLLKETSCVSILVRDHLPLTTTKSALFGCSLSGGSTVVFFSRENFKENVPTYFRYTGGEFTMIQMDANTRKFERKRETWDIVYIIIRRFYITLLRGRFLLLFFCERLITLIF